MPEDSHWLIPLKVPRRGPFKEVSGVPKATLPELVETWLGARGVAPSSANTVYGSGACFLLTPPISLRNTRLNFTIPTKL